MLENEQIYHLLVDLEPIIHETFSFNLTISGPAQAGSDFVAINTTQNVSRSQSRLSIQITTVDDTLYEGEETATFHITVNHQT